MLNDFKAFIMKGTSLTWQLVLLPVELLVKLLLP